MLGSNAGSNDASTSGWALSRASSERHAGLYFSIQPPPWLHPQTSHIAHTSYQRTQGSVSHGKPDEEASRSDAGATIVGDRRRDPMSKFPAAERTSAEDRSRAHVSELDGVSWGEETRGGAHDEEQTRNGAQHWGTRELMPGREEAWPGAVAFQQPDGRGGDARHWRARAGRQVPNAGASSRRPTRRIDGGHHRRGEELETGGHQGGTVSQRGDNVLAATIPKNEKHEGGAWA